MKTLDPRTKLIMVMTLSTLAVVIKRPGLLFVIWIITLILLQAFSVSIIGAFKRLRHFISLFMGIVFIQSVFSPGGNTLLELFGVRIITSGGILTGLSVILRMFIIISSALILSTTSPAELIAGLASWKIPYEIVFMVFLGIKFLPILTEEITDSVIAIQLAGADLKHTPLRRKLSLYTYIFMPVVMSTLLRARQISIAMESRAFRAYPVRTFYRKLTMKPRDWAIIFATLASGVVVLAAL